MKFWWLIAYAILGAIADHFDLRYLMVYCMCCAALEVYERP